MIVDRETNFTTRDDKEDRCMYSIPRVSTNRAAACTEFDQTIAHGHPWITLQYIYPKQTKYTAAGFPFGGRESFTL